MYSIYTHPNAIYPNSPRLGYISQETPEGSFGSGAADPILGRLRIPDQTGARSESYAEVGLRAGEADPAAGGDEPSQVSAGVREEQAGIAPRQSTPGMCLDIYAYVNIYIYVLYVYIYIYVCSTFI